MTLAEQLLPKLSDWRPTGDGRHSLSVACPEYGWSVGVAVDRVDTVGCVVWELSLARSDDAPAGLTVADWANRVATRSRSLLEPLTVLEVDTTRDEAVLRSKSPTVRGECRFYSEVVLTGTTRATVRRYEAVGTARREQIGYAMTHEQLATLAGELADDGPHSPH